MGVGGWERANGLEYLVVGRRRAQSTQELLPGIQAEVEASLLLCSDFRGLHVLRAVLCAVLCAVCCVLFLLGLGRDKTAHEMKGQMES